MSRHVPIAERSAEHVARGNRHLTVPQPDPAPDHLGGLASSAHYERAGLIQAVGRSTGGQRRYATSDLDWLRFLLRLRATGMPIASMRQFAELRRAGSAGVSGRIAVLSEHGDDVYQHIADLKGHLEALGAKLDDSCSP